MAGGNRHILNLGHGIDQTTPEDAVHTFVETAKSTKIMNAWFLDLKTKKKK